MQSKIITWTHPSYRDLVIDELVRDQGLRRKFLNSMSLEGVKLAISDTGGSEGQRVFPLMIDEDSWNLLCERCVQIVQRNESFDLVPLLTTLFSVAEKNRTHLEFHRLSKIITAVCKTARSRWNSSDTPLRPYELRAYCLVSIFANPLPPLPQLLSSWESATKQFRASLATIETQGDLEPSAVETWIRLAEIIRENEPRFLRQIGFPDNFHIDIAKLIKYYEEELLIDPEESSYDDLVSKADDLDSIASSLQILRKLIPRYRTKLSKLADLLSKRANELREEARDLEPYRWYEEDDFDSHQEFKDEFDIEALFEDL